MDSPAEGGIGAGQPVYKAFIFPERHNDLDDPRGAAGLLLARHAWTLLWGFPRSCTLTLSVKYAPKYEDTVQEALAMLRTVGMVTVF